MIFEKMHCWASIRFDETESQGENEESLLLLLDFDNQPDLETTERETQSSFSRKETHIFPFYLLMALGPLDRPLRSLGHIQPP